MSDNQSNLSGPGVILQAFYWNVPSPNDNESSASVWWWDHLASQTNSFAKAGFTAIWIPPVYKGMNGVSSSGYDPFDDYDIGNKDQKGSIPNRYGSREQLQQACAKFRANGLDIYADIVDSHRDGHDNSDFGFHYVNFEGTPNTGRFGKSNRDFNPTAPADPSIPDQNGRDSDGDWIMPTTGGETIINGQKWIWADYGMKQALIWLINALDLQGFRFDEVCSIPPGWLYSLMNYQIAAGKFCVSEYWITDENKLDNWVNTMQARTCAFDFPLRENYIAPMCNNPASFNMSSLNSAGYVGMNSFNAVTFVENHDTDNSSDKIYANKLLGYAFILTSEGYPCVFYRDWSTEPGCYGNGMQAQINKLIAIHQKIASGKTVQRWQNKSIYCYERIGGNHLLTALNAAENIQTITCATGFPPNTVLTDYTGNQPDINTDSNGNVTISIPGLGYVSYSVANIDLSIPAKSYLTTQVYEGACDLDIEPATSEKQVNVCTVLVSPGSDMTAALEFDCEDWSTSTRIDVTIIDESGNIVIDHSYSKTAEQGSQFVSRNLTEGKYTITVQSFDTPATNRSPAYSLSVTYLSQP